MNAEEIRIYLRSSLASLLETCMDYTTMNVHDKFMISKQEKLMELTRDLSMEGHRKEALHARTLHGADNSSGDHIMCEPIVTESGLLDESSSSTAEPHGLIINYNLHVNNQFLFRVDVKNACVPISMLAIYHIHKNYVKNASTLCDQEWDQLIRSGNLLWNLWKEDQLNRNQRRGQVLPSPMKLTNFPTVHEILSLSDMSPFRSRFGETPEEYGEHVHTLDGIDNPEGSLKLVLQRMVELTLGKQDNSVCVVLTLPNYNTVSLVTRHRIEKDESGYSIFLFDSHGGSGSGAKYCEFMCFEDYRDVLCHLTRKYELERTDFLRMNKREKSLYCEEELCAMSCYSALIFRKVTACKKTNKSRCVY